MFPRLGDLDDNSCDELQGIDTLSFRYWGFGVLLRVVADIEELSVAWSLSRNKPRCTSDTLSRIMNSAGIEREV
jgi:hypothetical protein